MNEAETTYNAKLIGQQLRKLSEYLRLPAYTMTKRCGLTQANLVETYEQGLIIPSLATINKILNRYPVQPEWLLRNKGDMWKEDYFENRFDNYKGNPKKPSEKLNALLEILEVPMRQISRDTTISTASFFKMKNDVWDVIPDKLIRKFREAYPFIPYEWYL